MRKNNKTKYNPALTARIDISVVKQRYVCYNGKRINYDTIVNMVGNRDVLIQLLKKGNYGPSPPALYGGPSDRGQCEYVVDILESWGFDRDKLTIAIRFFVTSCGSITPSIPPNPVTRIQDYNAPNCLGFEKRSQANEAAQLRYEYYLKWCCDEKKKPTNVVTLTLHDKDGNVTKKLTNQTK